MLRLLVISLALLVVGCESEDWSEEEIQNVVKSEVGSVDIQVGNGATIGGIDTLEAPVDIVAGNGATIGRINTGPAAQSE